MHPTLGQELPLTSIPRLVARLAFEHGSKRFQIGAGIASMVGKRLPRPGRDTVITLGHVQLPGLIVKPLTPAEQFIGELLLMSIACGRTVHGRHDLARPKNAKMKVRRKAACAIGASSIVPSGRVGGQYIRYEAFEPFDRCLATSRVQQRHRQRMIDLEARNQVLQIVPLKPVRSEGQITGIWF